MEESTVLFNNIIDNLSSQYPEVTSGKMMSSPGIKYRNKVFAFYHANHMVFRLGKDFIPEEEGISTFNYLSPFKNKPPMKGWVEIPFVYHKKWPDLAEMALMRMKKDID